MTLQSNRDPTPPQDQLTALMTGLQAHITDQQRGPLVKALSRLRDSAFTDHIRLALYTFPDAVRGG